jgi:hypothetical protein
VRNATCIYLYERTCAPVVFDTALLEEDRRKLSGWIAGNPELQALVSRARELAELALGSDDRR